jgi:hypothetical protein
MVKRKPKVLLELVGLDGNAFNLLGHSSALHAVRGSEIQIKWVIVEATRGDYDYLLRVLMENTSSPDHDA